MGAAPELSGPHEADGGEDGLQTIMGGDWPPGFRFHPTDEELVLYYLKRKICCRRIKLNMIGDVDVYKWEPWELPDKSLLRSGDKQWYYFTPRDRKYPNSLRSNRGTNHGYWKATGKDRTISHNSKAVGNKKTLVYHHGRVPKGERTDWVMYEYTLDEQVLMSYDNVQDYFALYKLFRKSGPGPKNGEQYGAPFKEEEWDEDIPDDIMKEHLRVNLVNGGMEPDEDRLPNCDIEDILLQMSNDDFLDCSFGNQANRGETNEHFQNHSFERQQNNDRNTDLTCDLEDILLQMSNELGVILQDSECSSKVPKANTERDVEAGFSNFVGTYAANEQLVGMPEVQGLVAVEDYLEIEDLNKPDSQVLKADELIDPDDYFDAQMYLAEAMGQSSHWDGFDYEEASHITTELWTHELDFSSSPSSGLMHANDNNASPSESWFGSTFSSLLDSVPSSPAFASENALINRAIERVSSFRVGQIRDAVPGRRQGGRNGGFLFISFLVGLGAVFWFLSIGAAIQVIKGFWGRFVSS